MKQCKLVSLDLLQLKSFLSLKALRSLGGANAPSGGGAKPPLAPPP